MKTHKLSPVQKLRSSATMALVCSLLLSNALANTTGTSIGLKFASTDPNYATSGLNPGDSAGVVPSVNWNNLTNASGSFSAVIADSSGSSVATPVSITWTSPNTYRSGANNAFPAGPNKKLTSGYLDSGNTTATGVFISVSNLPSSLTLAGYDVYVYFVRDTGDNTGGGYTMTNQTGFVRKYGSTMASPSSFVQDPGTDSNNSLDGNYLRFTNLGGNWFTLKTDTTLTSPNGFRAPVNAIEIVALPCTTVGIATQPATTTACSGSTVQLSVSATGSVPTYQWRKNGVDLINGPTGNGSTVSGATAATLTISSAAVADTADAGSGYDCVITAACDSSTTNTTRVALTVNPAAAVFSVTGGGSDCSGAGVAVELSGSETGVDYWLRTNGVFNGVVVAGTGSPLSLGFQSLNGTYTVFGSNTVGGCTALMSGSAVVAVTAATITVQPTNRTVCSSSSVSFSVGATGATTPRYQWRKNGVNLSNGPTGNGSTISGATNVTFTINPATAADAADSLTGYDCVISAPCETNSARVALTVNPTPTLFSLTGGGTICSGGSVTVILSGSQIGMDYRLRTNGVFNGVLVAGTGSPLSFPTLTAGGTYTVLASNLSGGCTAVMSGSAVVSIVAPLAITSGPTPTATTNFLGETATFSVAATGSGLNYQWYRDAIPLANGGSISGANTPTLTLSPTLISDSTGAGHGYRCVVNGSCGAPAISGEALLTVLPIAAFTELGAPAWTNRYAGIGRAEDDAVKGVMDTNGNFFVVGTSDAFLTGKDMVTVKYSSAGVPLWTRRYNGPANRDDFAKGLALDANGDVFVAGYSYNGTNDDYYTAKYAGTDGAVLWERRYNGPGNSADQATALAVDGNGNAIVTGQSVSTNCTVKYAAADGALLWERRANGLFNRYVVPVAIAADPNGDVVMTGPVSNGSDKDFYTAKYAAADGAMIWEGQNYITQFDQVPTAMAVDQSGNVWVVGWSGVSSLSDSYVVKYAAANGAVLYGVRFSSTGTRYDTATAIAVGPGGDVAVTSFRTGSFASHYWTTKYGADGSYLWEQPYIGTPDIYDSPSAVAVDASGNTVVTGYSRGIGNDYLTVKYATNGVVLWAKRYNGPANSADSAVAIGLDGLGNAVVTGISSTAADGTLGRDLYTAKYAEADGALLWEQRYDGPGNLEDIAKCAAVDGSGNVFVAGNSSRPGVASTTDFYTDKYAANGILLWQQRYGSTNGGADDLVALALDASGNVIVTGTSANDYYTAKYAAADGALVWERRYNGPASVDEVRALVVDGGGNAIVTGRSSNGSNDDYYTAKYAATDGSLLWERRFNTNSDVAEAVVVDNDGNVVVTGYSGYTDFSGVHYDYYTAKYAAADGALLWEKRYNGPANNGDFSKAVVLDAAGNVIVTGRSSNGTNDDYCTVKYAATDGSLLWEKRYNGPGSLLDQPSAMVVDGVGNAVVTGYASGYGYTAKYSAADGALLWEQRITNATPGSGYDFAAAADADGNIVVSAPVLAGGKPDYYTVKYSGTNGAPLWASRYNGPVNGNDQTYTRGALAIGPWGEIVVTGSSDGATNSSGAGNLDFVTIQYATLGFALHPSSVVTGGSIDFSPRGGRPPLLFSVTANNSGGTIDPNTGLYTAGNVCGVADTITLTDADGVSIAATVRVVASAPPAIVCPANIVIPSALPCSAPVTYSLTATDGCGLPLTPIVSPPSGSQFQVGATTVYCSATDDLGRTANCSFTVTVQSASPPCAPTPPGLVTFWRGDNDALDTTGTSHGLLNGAVNFNACGVGGAGFNFNSLGGYVSVPFSPALQQTNITAEAWIFAQGSPTAQAGILGTWNDITVSKRTYLMWVVNGKLEFLCYNGSSLDRATDPVALPANTWIHVAGTYDGTTIRLYRNGAEVAATAFAGTLATNDLPFHIGRTDSTSASDFWRGMIDEVSIYNRALSSSEITAIYAAGSAGKCLGSPILAIAPVATNVFTGGTVAFSASGGQPPYQFAIASNNSGGTINGSTGAYVAGNTPGTDTISVSDAVASNALATVAVALANTRPSLANPIPDTNGIYGTPFSFEFAADAFSDPDAGQALNYSAAGLPNGFTFNPATRSFSGTPTNIGTISVTVTATDNGSPALSTNDVFDLVIVKAPLTATADNKSRAYAQANPPLTVSYSGFVLGETAADVDTPPIPGTPAATGSPVGPYPITLGGGTDNHYDLSYVNGTLSINPATLTVTAGNTNRVYGELNPAFTGTIIGVANGDNLTATYGTTADTNSPPGTYPIQPVIVDPDTQLGNYTVTTNLGTLTVTAAPLTVTANDTNRVYGTANPDFTGSLVGVVNGDDITATFLTAATIADPPGTYPITPVLSDPAGKIGNYAVTTNTGTLTILSPPELTFTLGGGGGGLFTLSWPASYSGFVLEFAESLAAPIEWQPVTSGITENGGIKSYTVTNDPNVPGRLYRLRLP